MNYLSTLRQTAFRKPLRLTSSVLFIAIAMSGCGDDPRSTPDNPTNPITPVNPVNPSDPADPRDPVDPVNPIEPIETGDYALLSSDVERDLAPDATVDELNSFTLGNHQLTVDLHQNATVSGENTMLSTYSIRSAFSLLYPGARGETAEEIAEVMGFDDDIDRALTTMNAADLAMADRNVEADEQRELEAVSLHTANAFWSARGAQWSEQYLDRLALNLGAPVYLTDFANEPEVSRQTINQWVEDQTEERIEDLLPDGSISAATRAVLTNAVYFKAPWASKFKAEATHDREFNVLGGSSIPVPTMSQTTAIKYTEGEGYQAAQLPFRNGELAMVFILPDAGQLAEFEADLTAETLGEIATNLESVRAHIQIPKFEFETTTLLKDPLQTLGLRKIFSGGDLTGMSEQGNLSVSGVFHKTFIAVEEGGAEAAAATAIVIDRTSVEPDPEVIFKADRPFLFGIQDIETGLFLFFGRVVDPR